MPVITIRTEINSTTEICFDLSRSIDLHKHSMEHTKEEAIAGRISGLIEMDEFVTWQASHFGITQYLTSKITNYDRPFIFRDEQTKGIFDYFRHDHIFEEINGKVIMTDVFDYKAPFGFLGKIADKLFLENYMTNLLLQRNKIIKAFAETDKWKEVLAP
jgi:ligand-binding SRPBCC domain-containing protein